MYPESKIIDVQILLDFISQNWRNIAVPFAVFLFSLIALFQLRKWTLDRLSKWAKAAKWPAETILYRPIKRPFYILCIILSIYLGLAASLIPANLESLAANSLWTLFVFALVLAAFNMLQELILFFGRHLNLPGAMPIIRNITSIVIIVISVLVVLGIWGVPTGPLLILIAVAAVLALLTLRDAAPNLFAGFQLVTWQNIKIGDSIKLENGEEGCITRIGWNNTQLQTLGGDILIIPNSQLTRQRIIKFGPLLKKLQETDPSFMLSERELEIARLISQGATNKEISEKLFIAENTAKVHVKNILGKLELKNRQQLAVYTALKERVKTTTNTTK
jgi:small-conductance mechanosensitive channel/DNA-binding CsgD family transcriptional regulator